MFDPYIQYCTNPDQGLLDNIIEKLFKFLWSNKVKIKGR